MASEPGASFRWISPSELQDHIASRAHTEVPRAKAKKSRSSRPSQAPLSVDPDQLLLAPGSFVSADGEPLCQLSFAEVKSQASGICFCSPQQAAPFIADARNLSVDALGLLITAEVPQDTWLSLFRFPAVYAPTKEAVLIAGTLLQLGDSEVQVAPTNVTDVEMVDTITVRVSLYRHQTKLPWEQVTDAPIRTLLQHTPELQVCKDEACGQSCPKFHAAVDETVEQMFVDLWGRNFCKLSGGCAKPQDAELFQFLARIPASAIGVFKASVGGVYFDPRGPDGAPHAAWGVVWLPGSTYLQAQRALQTQAKALALVRLASKYGLRTREADEQALFTALRLQHEYVRMRITSHFRLHPLPHGYQRHNLAQLLRQWSWAARPLQADRGDADGAAWLVGSAEDPPGVAMAKVKEVGPRKPANSSICTSTRTRKHLLLDDDREDADPWQHGLDPWAAAKHSFKPEVRSTSAAVTKMQQLQDDLKQDVDEIVRQHVVSASAAGPPGLPKPDPRVDALEVGLTELKCQNSKFEEWFQSFGTRVNDQAQAAQNLQAQVQEQNLSVPHGPSAVGK